MMLLRMVFGGVDDVGGDAVAVEFPDDIQAVALDCRQGQDQ